MASAVREPQGLRAGRAGAKGATVPVILDSGRSVRVVAIDVERAPWVGMRFEHGGRVWEITRAKDYARGWVARPVPRRGLVG